MLGLGRPNPPEPKGRLQRQMCVLGCVCAGLSVCVCARLVSAHPLHLVGDGDLQQGGEIGQACAPAGPQDGQACQEHVQGAPLGGDSQQLPVICPAQLVQTWGVKRGQNRGGGE